MHNTVIAASILSADMSKLGEDTKNVLDAGADFIHVDVMDNHYVPNLTFGPIVVRALRNFGIQAPLDVHLMIDPVDRIIPEFAEAGADYITFHPEASENIGQTLNLIRQCKCKPGLVFNPGTPLDILEGLLDKIDIVLLMSVNPGFGGQSFIESVFDKLKYAREIIDKSKYDVRLEIDGGVKVDNIQKIAKAGADTFVAGSAIFGEDNYKSTIKMMREKIALANN
jgi:ribulose-phosphate 3-epimerase